MTKKANSTKPAQQKANAPQVKQKANAPQAQQKANTPQQNSRHHLNKNELSKSAKSSMLTRILSAIVGLAIVVPAMVLGDWIYFGFITIALGIACWEILGCANKRTVLIFIIYFIFVAMIAYWPMFKQMLINGFTLGKIDNYFQSVYLSVVIVVLGIFFLFGLTVIYKDFTVLDACFLIAMGVLIGFGFQCLFFLRYFPNVYFGTIGDQSLVFTVDNTIKPSLLLLFVIVATFLTDTGAYFVGVFFGKNKMNERISPKKTWEGFVGGIVISFLVSSGIGLAFAAGGYPILPIFDLEHWYFIMILSLLIPLLATLGDFVFSSIKRYWGIKDYGKLIPGHGGVLDRLDSIFFAVIISSVFVFMLYSLNEAGDFNWSQFLV